MMKPLIHAAHVKEGQISGVPSTWLANALMMDLDDDRQA